MKWKVGDLAIIACSPEYPERVGLICEIIQLWSTKPGRIRIHIPDLPPIPVTERATGFRCIQPEFLRPLDDGNQKTTWDECPFKPKELIRTPSKPHTGVKQ